MAARGAGKKPARSLERNSEKRAPREGKTRRPHARKQTNSVRDRDENTPQRPKDGTAKAGWLGKRPRATELDFHTGDRLIDMAALKLAVRVLPAGSAARLLILEEPDQMPMSEYCVKIGMWFKLLRTAKD